MGISKKICKTIRELKNDNKAGVKVCQNA